MRLPSWQPICCWPTARSCQPLPPNARVLDACAAPGGKTAHLLELAGGALDLLAIDRDASRLQRVEQTLARLSLQAGTRAADAAAPADWWDGRPFDAILLDAPCSASGIVRRHPDIRWLRRPTDIDVAGTDPGQAARCLVAPAEARRPLVVLHLLGLQGRGTGANRRIFTTPARRLPGPTAGFAGPPAAPGRQSGETTGRRRGRPRLLLLLPDRQTLKAPFPQVPAMRWPQWSTDTIAARFARGLVRLALGAADREPGLAVGDDGMRRRPHPSCRASR